MHDRMSELENYHQLKYSREQGFFDKSLSIRILIGVVFVFSLFLFLHFREVKVETLELNSIAPSYIVAQVDIEFFDEDATETLKKEAVRDVGKIYQLSDREVRSRRKEFEDYLVSHEEWREEVPNSTFEDMYKGVDLLHKSLLTLRLSDPRTIQKMKQLSLPIAHFDVIKSVELGVSRTLPEKTWDTLASSTFIDRDIHEETIEYILSYFKKQKWKLVEDDSNQRALVRRVEGTVPHTFSHVAAGRRIIDQGERVTARHIAVLQAMKEKLGSSRNLWHPLTLSGSLLMTLLVTAISVVYLFNYFPQLFRSNRKLFLLVTVIILTFGYSKITEFILLSSKSDWIEVVRYPLIIPFAAILLSSLLNSSLATFVTGFLTIILTIALAFDQQGFMMMNLSAAMVAILTARSLRQRKEVFVVCAKAWLCSVVVIMALHFYKNTYGDGILADMSSAGVFMLLTAVLVVGLLPLLESTFRIMTDVTLMEYMDPNHDLLRRLTIEAPGTYQHSVVVGNLAEAAALAIGANGLFCRVSTLFHDIGKMATPQYFTENQQGDMNIHQLLTPKESAQVIIAHVAEGVAMARKANLPEQFIDIIKEHHGTTLVYYFYRKQLEKVGGDKGLVDEKEFRYAGPKPRSKESAIIMIADCLEAASRTLDQVDEQSVDELVNRIIKEKVDDGQFDNCLLTCEELATVRVTLVKTLVAFAHSRVKYPKGQDD